MILSLLRAARPGQWVKNLFVGAPLIFAKTLLDTSLAGRAAAAVAIFCVVSSAVYLLNDVIDVDKDRAHPRKRHRPIASGALPIPLARIAAGTLGAVGLSLALVLDPWVALAAGVYLVLNIAYSLALKRVPYVDVLIIAAGFLLRVWGGSVAIDVHASPWLLVCTGLLACFLAFGKRTHELATAGARGADQRAVLAAYHPTRLRVALYATGAATVVAYSLYALSSHTAAFFGTTLMVWTVPSIAIGVSRFIIIVADGNRADSPTEEMLRDPLFLLNLLAWVVAVIVIIYVARG